MSSGKKLRTTNDVPGTYILEDINSDRLYIGSTKGLSKRINGHFAALKRGDHENRYLQQTYDSGGLFVVTQYEADDQLQARKFEEELLRQHADNPNLLNLTLKAGGGFDLSLHPNAEQIRKNLSNGQLNRTDERIRPGQTTEAKNKISESLKDSYANGRIAQHPSSRPVSINGMEYPSANAAAKDNGVSVELMRWRLNSQTERFKDWFYIPVEKANNA